MRIERSLIGLVGCGIDWIISRLWRKVLLCFLPALLALGLVGLTLVGTWRNKNELADLYMQAANQEVDGWEKQWEGKGNDANIASDKEPPIKIPAAAEMLFRRVQQLQQNDARSVFFVALSYIQRGAVQQGLTMLGRIAPAERVGYPPAHAYLAEQMLLRPPLQHELPILRHHVEAALTYRQISPQLLAMISQFFARLDNLPASLDAIKSAAKIDGKFNLLLAQQFRSYKPFEKDCKEALVKAQAHFEEKLKANAMDVGARLMLADVHLLNNNDVAAEKTIVDGLMLGDNPVLKSALAEIYRQAFVKTAVFKDNTWSGDMELLEKAFQLDPNNLLIFEEVAKLARVDGSTPNEPLMDQLRKNLAEGRATSVTHMWISEHYLQSNQLAKAVPHLEQAVKRDPNFARCWNNLACCLLELYPDRLEEALSDVDKAIAVSPVIPDYHDTRGTILMRLNRPSDAVTSYERAIEAARKSGGRFPPQAAFHSRLAQAYEAVGDKAMADTHRTLASELSPPKEKPAEEKPAEENP